MSVRLHRVERRYAVVAASADGVAARWERQYATATDPKHLDITRQLKALTNPTKSVVDCIIGNESWTGVWCGSCSEYRSHAVSFGDDYPSEICVDCMSAALRDLRVAIKKAEGRADEQPERSEAPHV